MAEFKQLSLEEAKKIYKEPIISGGSFFFFENGRRFTEFLGAQIYSRELKVVSKGWYHQVNLVLPSYVPIIREGLVLNWFQIALEKDSAIPDPINCPARYKGFLPGYLVEEGTKMSSSGTRPEYKITTFHMVSELEHFDMADYALFIYDRADYSEFLDQTQELLGKYKDQGKELVQDEKGNKIMISDSSTDQSMLLMPLDLLVGGAAFALRAWSNVIS